MALLLPAFMAFSANHQLLCSRLCSFLFSTMPMKAMKTMKAMKAMKAGSSKAMTKGALTAAIAEEHELKQKVCREVLDSFVAIAAAEVKKNGIFNVPNLFRIKTRVKPATKAGTRMMFGKEVKWRRGQRRR